MVMDVCVAIISSLHQEHAMRLSRTPAQDASPTLRSLNIGTDPQQEESMSVLLDTVRSCSTFQMCSSVRGSWRWSMAIVHAHDRTLRWRPAFKRGRRLSFHTASVLGLPIG